MATTIDSWADAMKLLGEDREEFSSFFWRFLSDKEIEKAGARGSCLRDEFPPPKLLGLVLERANKFLDQAVVAQRKNPHLYSLRDSFIYPNDYGSPGGKCTLARKLLVGLIARYRRDGTLSPELMPMLINVLMWLAS